MRKIFGTPKGARYDDFNDDKPEQKKPVTRPPGFQGFNSPEPVPTPVRQPVNSDTPKPIQRPVRSEPQIGPSSTTLIGNGIIFEGKVKGNGMVRVEGKFIGTIEVKNNVVIGDSGIVEGNIQSKSVSVLGKIIGNVNATDKITIDGSGSMIGDIMAPSVIVSEGAIYKGRIDMEPKAAPKTEKDVKQIQGKDSKKEAAPQPVANKSSKPTNQEKPAEAASRPKN